ncbi:MAG: hypothetical protein AB8B55_09355 [Mariniblastus sp.]
MFQTLSSFAIVVFSFALSFQESTDQPRVASSVENQESETKTTASPESESADQPLSRLMPKPLPAIDDTFRFERKSFLGKEDIVDDSMEELKKLCELHEKRFDEIETLKGYAWLSLIQAGEKSGSTILMEYAYQNQPVKHKRIIKYRPLKKLLENPRKRDGPNMFEPMFARISTPEMFIEGDAHFMFGEKKGLVDFKIKQPKQSFVDKQLNFDSLFLPAYFATDGTKNFFSEMERLVVKLKYEIEIRIKGDLLEMRLTNITAKENFFLFVCDLSKNGNLIYCDDMCGFTEIEYQKVDDSWLPTVYRQTKVKAATKKITGIEVYRYFNMSLNNEFEESVFQLKSLPVRNKYTNKVMDLRSPPYAKNSVVDYIKTNESSPVSENSK